MPSTVALSSWAEILDQVGRALVQVEQEAARASAFWTADVASARSSIVVEQPSFQDYLQQAEQIVAETNSFLQASEAALHQWLARMEAIRQKLATAAGSSI